jgi:hypothetical protein
MYCSLNWGIRQGLIERSIGAPDQCWFYERAMGSTCSVHEVTYGQFSNLNSINNIQISNFNFLKFYPCSSLLTIFGRERWGALALYIMLCERAIGSTCGVHELTYGQFFNLNIINYIQISNFIFFCGVHKVTYEEIYICLCYRKKITY